MENGSSYLYSIISIAFNAANRAINEKYKKYKKNENFSHDNFN
jgi:hypothetical protein